MKNLRVEAESSELGFCAEKAAVCWGVGPGSPPKQREAWAASGTSASGTASLPGSLRRVQTPSTHCPLSSPLGTARFPVSGVAQDEAGPCRFASWVALSDQSGWCLTSSPTGFSLQDADTCVLVPDTLPCA